MLEGVGVSISSLFFSLVEFGILTTQVIFIRKYWRMEAFRIFTVMTSLFLFFNVSLLLVSIDSLSTTIGTSLRILNTITIGLYLFFMNINTLLPRSSAIKKVPWLIVALSIAFGIQGLMKTFELDQNDIVTNTNLGVPVLFTITIVVLLLGKAGGKRTSWNSFWLLLLVFVTIVFASFSIYIEEELDLVAYLYINFVFLLFSTIQYWQLKLAVDTKGEETINASSTDNSASEIDKLSEFGLSQTEREIVEMILDGDSYNEIAVKRSRSYSSVSSQASNAFSKIKVHTQDELIEKFKKN